jgi:hypothetical protein
MKLVTLISSLMIFSLSTHAFQFRANAQVYLDRTYGEVRVANYLNTPDYLHWFGGRLNLYWASGLFLYESSENFPRSVRLS